MKKSRRGLIVALNKASYNDFKKVIRDWQIIGERELFVIERRFYLPDFVLIIR